MKTDRITKAVNQICNEISGTSGKDWSKLPGDTILANGRVLKQVRMEIFKTVMGWN